MNCYTINTYFKHTRIKQRKLFFFVFYKNFVLVLKYFKNKNKNINFFCSLYLEFVIFSFLNIAQL